MVCGAAGGRAGVVFVADDDAGEGMGLLPNQRRHILHPLPTATDACIAPPRTTTQHRQEPAVMSSSTGGDGGSKEGGAPPADLFDGLFGDLPAEAAATATKKPPSTSAAAAMKKEEEGKAAAVAAEEDGTKKRKAGAAAGGEEWEEEGGGSGGTKRSKEEGEGKGQKGGTVELEVALQKISVALRSSKVEKFRKVRGGGLCACVSWLSIYLSTGTSTSTCRAGCLAGYTHAPDTYI